MTKMRGKSKDVQIPANQHKLGEKSKPDAVMEAPKTSFETLKILGAFLGSLSGASVGIGAVLYAFGYLINRSHSHLLGLPDALLEFDSSLFLEYGGKFVYYVALRLSEGMVIVFCAATLVMLMWEAFRLLPLIARIKASLAGWSMRWAFGLKRVVLAMSLFLLLREMLSGLSDVMQPLDCANLLIGDGESKPCAGLDNGDGETSFFFLLVANVKLGGLFLCSRWASE